MKRKTLWMLLILEAGVCVLLRTHQVPMTIGSTSVLAFPFEQIGLGLRALSLSGGLGNVAACILYAAVSLIPVAALAVLMLRHKARPEDGLLVLLSAALFAVLYLMVNPAIIGSLFGASALPLVDQVMLGGLDPSLGGSAALPAGKAILGTTVYSVLVGYLVLRVLRLFFAGSTEKLQKYLADLLFCMNLLFVWLAFGVGFSKMMDSIQSLGAGNTAGGQLMGMSTFVLVLQFLVDALPYLLDVLVVFAALRLLDELKADRYSPESVEAARRLSRLCGGALAATTLTNMAFNLLQLLVKRSALVINSSVEIPVFSIVFVLAVLLFARFIAQSKQLKDDNELFI